MQCFNLLVPVEGIEPPLLAEHDFESCASTSSATRARALCISADAALSKMKIGGLASTAKIGKLPATPVRL